MSPFPPRPVLDQGLFCSVPAWLEQGRGVRRAPAAWRGPPRILAGGSMVMASRCHCPPCGGKEAAPGGRGGGHRPWPVAGATGPGHCGLASDGLRRLFRIPVTVPASRKLLSASGAP